MDANKDQLKKFVDTKKYPTLISISKKGQQYVDEPVYVVLAKVKGIVKTMCMLFRTNPPEDLKELVNYKRHILAWRK